MVARIYLVFGSVSTSAKRDFISSSVAIPKARNKAVAAIFLFLSIRTDITPLDSVSNSSQAPREGISLALKSFLDLPDRDREKKTPGLLINWEITTLSTLLIINVPRGVIIGKSAKNISCS